MFLGEFIHSIDGKGRLTVPAKFRAALAAGMVVTRGLDRCLFVFPAAQWERRSKAIAKMPLTQRDARAFSRFVFSGAMDVVPDKQGRVLLPAYLREYAGIDGDAIIIGLHDRIEIWNPDRWRDVKLEAEENMELIAEKLGDLEI
jgi:MraZ protein